MIWSVFPLRWEGGHWNIWSSGEKLAELCQNPLTLQSRSSNLSFFTVSGDLLSPCASPASRFPSLSQMRLFASYKLYLLFSPPVYFIHSLLPATFRLRQMKNRRSLETFTTYWLTCWILNGDLVVTVTQHSSAAKGRILCRPLRPVVSSGHPYAKAVEKNKKRQSESCC